MAGSVQARRSKLSRIGGTYLEPAIRSDPESASNVMDLGPIDNQDICLGCGHLRRKHYRDMDGIIRCMVEHHGVSDRGVIGIPYTRECLCQDNKLPPRRKTQEEIDFERNQEFLMNKIRESLQNQESDTSTSETTNETKAES